MSIPNWTELKNNTDRIEEGVQKNNYCDMKHSMTADGIFDNCDNDCHSNMHDHAVVWFFSPAVMGLTMYIIMPMQTSI